jgi:hypothetical protein
MHNPIMYSQTVHSRTVHSPICMEGDLVVLAALVALVALVVER